MKQRLHKIIANATSFSLRAAEREISLGHVCVNGKKVTEQGMSVDAMRDEITIEGKILRIRSSKTYLKYYKPKKRIVSKSDDRGRKTIWNDLDRYKHKLNSAGRLDYDSEGLLIITNDGELINLLTHPRYHLEKVYMVKIKGSPKDEELMKLQEGTCYEGVTYQPCKMKRKEKVGSHVWFEVTIFEGKNRQIRNMFNSIDYDVVKLKRIAIGPIKLGTLKPGECMKFTFRELSALRTALKIADSG